MFFPFTDMRASVHAHIRTPCTGYFSIAWIKHHDQSNLQKEGFRGVRVYHSGKTWQLAKVWWQEQEAK